MAPHGTGVMKYDTQPKLHSPLNSPKITSMDAACENDSPPPQKKWVIKVEPTKRWNLEGPNVGDLAICGKMEQPIWAAAPPGHWGSKPSKARKEG